MNRSEMPSNSHDDLPLGDLVNEVNVVDTLLAVFVPLVDRVNSQEAGPTVRFWLHALADRNFGRFGFGVVDPELPVAVGATEPVQLGC
jgi:hypothetical protein